MSDTLEARRASKESSQPAALLFDLSRPAAFTSGSFLPADPLRAGTAPQPASTPPAPTLLFHNTTAMLGLPQPTLIQARPSPDQQKTIAAARVAQKLEAFGITSVIAPDMGHDSGKADLAQHGFADSENASSNDLVSNFLPTRGLLRCILRRERTGFIITDTKYYLHLEKGDRFLLAARKRKNKQTANYLISTSEDDLERQSSHFHAKLRGSFTGLEFVIFNNGESPEKALDVQHTRTELGAILYEPNIAGTKGPRGMTVVLPLRDSNGDLALWQPRVEGQSIVAAYRNDPNSDQFVVLVNNEPTWNEQLRSYQLNFHGRVTKPSVKNFQLVDRRHPQRIVMQFGKRDEDIFALDFQSPLTATQAFAIALTAFDNKLACD